MSKHLIYLGYTGTAHRIALFDSEDILAKSVPVKDVPKLPDNVEYMNCTVKDGQVIPNLKGAKVLCAVSKEANPTYISNYQLNYDMSKLWIDKDKKPEYFYGYSEYEYKYRKTVHEKYTGRFQPGSLLFGGTGCNVWDGTCTENTMYLIAVLSVRKSTKRFTTTGSTLCMTHSGELFYSCAQDMRVCLKSGLTYVQVGTPDLSCPDVYNHRTLVTDKFPLVCLSDEDNDRLIWQGRKKYDVSVSKTAESVWWNSSWRTTVCDLRIYPRSRVFGINSIADATIVIFPESTEEIWLGLLQHCPSLKLVYIPPSVRLVRDYAIPSRRIKKIKFYSTSPSIVDFCAKYGAERVDCGDAEEMLSEFYKASDSDYISLDDANGIANLAGAQSDKAGVGGTVWSAALFSIASKGMATEELHTLYPVVDTCDGKYSVPTRNIEVMGVGVGSCEGHGTYGKERTRTMAAAFTQFYPLCTKEYDVHERTIKYNKYRLGDYQLYLGLNAFESKKKQKSSTPKKEDVYALNHVALLVCPRGDVIHRFACGSVLTRVLRGLEGTTFTDKEPCGVLRYADKLPVMYGWGNTTEHMQVREALFQTFMVFSFGVKGARRTMVGIDLHTGALATAEFIPNSYDDRINNRLHLSSQADIAHNFVSVNRLSNIKRHLKDADLSHLFEKDCMYNKSK